MGAKRNMSIFLIRVNCCVHGWYFYIGLKRTTDNDIMQFITNIVTWFVLRE